MPEWRKNDMQGEVIEMQVRKQGIWWNCMFYSTGQWHCDDFDRFFIGLPGRVLLIDEISNRIILSKKTLAPVV